MPGKRMVGLCLGLLLLLTLTWMGYAGVRQRMAEKEAERVEQLNRALSHWDSAAVKRLVRAGADFNKAGDYDGTALVQAIVRGDLPFVEELLRRGADPNFATRQDLAPLQVAASWGRADCVRLLLKHGADPNVGSHPDDLPIRRAARRGYLDVVQILREAGATVRYVPPPSLAQGSFRGVLAQAAGAGHFSQPVLVEIFRHLPDQNGVESVRFSRIVEADPDSGEGRVIHPLATYSPRRVLGLADLGKNLTPEPSDPRGCAVRAACDHAFEESRIGAEFEVRVEEDDLGFLVDLRRVSHAPDARWRLRVSPSYCVVALEESLTPPRGE